MSADTGAPLPRYFTPDRLYRLSVAQYHKMIEFGILTKDDRVELIEGFLVRKLPETPAHDRALRCTVEAINRALTRAFGNQAAENIPADDVLG
jgi:hypothetical protein